MNDLTLKTIQGLAFDCFKELAPKNTTHWRFQTSAGEPLTVSYGFISEDFQIGFYSKK